VNDVGYVLHEDETTDISDGKGEFFGEEEEIVFAEGADFDEVCVFVVGDVGLVVGSDEFFWRISPS